MPCEHYQDALVAAAATGANPQGELRSHLVACADCRATLEQEVSLFVAIDSNLIGVANSKTPPSLLPRVRAAIAESPAPTRAWLPGYAFAAVTAAVVLTIFFALRPHQPGPINQANQAPPARQPLAPSASPESPLTASTLAAAANHQASRPRTSAPAQHIHPPQPEVIVPADQDVLLAGYADEWRTRKHPPLQAEASIGAILVPLELAPIQIDHLDVKLLAEEKSQ